MSQPDLLSPEVRARLIGALLSKEPVGKQTDASPEYIVQVLENGFISATRAMQYRWELKRTGVPANHYLYVDSMTFAGVKFGCLGQVS